MRPGRTHLAWLCAAALCVVPVLLVSAAGVGAAPREIELSPEEGGIGDRVDVEGTGFPPTRFQLEEYTFVDIYFSEDRAYPQGDVRTDITHYEIVKSGLLVDDAGQFVSHFAIPRVLTDGESEQGVHRGAYYVYITLSNETRIKAAAEFTVVAAQIEANPAAGPVGTELELRGVDFSYRNEFDVTYDGADLEVLAGDERTTKDGELSCRVRVPESPAGDHAIEVVDESDVWAETVFTVVPEAVLEPTEGSCTDRVKVRGTGFGAEADFVVMFDGEEVATGNTDREGSMTARFEVPGKAAWSYDVVVEDEDENRARVDFAVVCELQLSQTSGSIGTRVKVSGGGFEPGARLEVLYGADSRQVARTEADDGGRFSVGFVVPPSGHGDQKVVVSDGVASVTATFVVESTPPAPPQLLSPEMGARAEAQARFDWRDVEDPSGVTYRLQIARDTEFDEGSLVLDKAGLIDSEYQLSEEEQLEPTKKESPYYWHVTAVDGAGNTATSSVSTFHVGFSFAKLPAWVKVLLLAVPVGLLVYVVSVLLRRAAYR
ncbi:MAG: hypothetical protein ACOC6A_02565 [Chloroflexota bacterium]